MFIVLVAIFAFGISTQALLFPNQDLSWTLLGKIFLPAYFIISGEDYYTRDTILGALQAGLSSRKKI